MTNPNEPPAATLEQIGDALPWPLLVLRDDGTLLHANQAARQALARGTPLMLDDAHRVIATDAAQRPALATALSASRQALLTVAAPQGGDCAVIVKPLRAAPLLRLVALGLPGARADELQGFAQLHQLSALQTQLLDRLVHGDNCTAAARALGLSDAAARTQIAALRHRTGHASMTALLRELTTMPPLPRLQLLHLLHLLPALAGHAA